MIIATNLFVFEKRLDSFMENSSTKGYLSWRLIVISGLELDCFSIPFAEE